jgi:hypothetical protein
MIPDRLPEALRDAIRQFPSEALQFEIGVQTFDETVAARIGRRQNYRLLEENFRFLRSQTGVHIHADLIAGLPGETMESFGAGFNRLVALNPQEIQVGILKRLRGTPIVRHDSEWQMVYNPYAPYEILSTKTIPFSQLQQLRRFARNWDLLANSGNFVTSTPLLWQDQASAFAGFLRWSDWLHQRLGRTHSIALGQLAELLFEYLTGPQGLEPGPTAQRLWQDYKSGGRNDVPVFLRQYLPPSATVAKSSPGSKATRRQARHRAGMGWETP